MQKFGHALDRLLKSRISHGHQKLKKANDFWSSTLLLRNEVFLRIPLKKFAVKHNTLKVYNYATDIKSVLKSTIGAFPATLEKSGFSEPCCGQSLLRIEQAPNVQNMLQTPKAL